MSTLKLALIVSSYHAFVTDRLEAMAALVGRHDGIDGRCQGAGH